MTAPQSIHGSDVDFRGKRVLVAGGGGFIGGHLARRMLARGAELVRVADIKQLDDWYQVHEKCENLVLDLSRISDCRIACDGIDYVFNLAADMGGMGFIENNKSLCMLSVLINTHLLEASRDSGAERFFFASSACVYNADKQKDPDVTPLREEDAYPALPEDGYGWEKLFSERMCRHFREDFGLETRIARFHNIYGPNGTFDGGREKAPAALSRKVIEAKYSGELGVEIWGDGAQTRSFTYIEDCLDGIERVFCGHVAEPLNVGSSELVTIDQLVDVLEEIAEVKLDRKYNLTAPRGVNGRNSDNTRILSAYGWEPTTPLFEGMRQTYAWILGEMQSRERFSDLLSAPLSSPSPSPWPASSSSTSSTGPTSRVQDNT
ncbi:MAG: NAD-dependent epimerase/dehydratase family protein [Planctomycetota bacterium]